MRYLVSFLASFAIILTRKRELVAFFFVFFFCCLGTVNVPCLFRTVPWVGLRCEIVVFPVHAHFLLLPFFIYL